MNKCAMLKPLLTLGPIGYLPASGTCASLVTLPFAFLLAHALPLSWYALVIAVGTCISCAFIYVCRAHFTQQDPSEIVIDEVFGCALACFALPALWWAWALAFVLFRIFDIFKFSIIGYAEKLPGAFGIMADDLIAGFLSAICVHLMLYGIKVYSAL
jgi:phosphatidylglycerophosphatase A